MMKRLQECRAVEEVSSTELKVATGEIRRGAPPQLSLTHLLNCKSPPAWSHSEHHP